MKYVIQHNLVNAEHLDQLKDIIAKNNLPHVFVGVIPFSREITCNEPLEGIDYIPYGSTSLTSEAYKLGWKGLYFNPETFRSNINVIHRTDMLNQDAKILTVQQTIDFLRQQPEEDVFIRPVEDLKQFAGQVLPAIDCLNWLEDAAEQASSIVQLQPDTMVVVAEPKNIQAEWRWFIIDGKVISGSMYRNRGQLIKKRENNRYVIAEAQKFADIWLPSPCCVMDLALVDNFVKVIEFNTINSSGFYDHDVDKIFVELYKYSCNH